MPNRDEPTPINEPLIPKAVALDTEHALPICSCPHSDSSNLQGVTRNAFNAGSVEVLLAGYVLSMDTNL